MCNYCIPGSERLDECIYNKKIDAGLLGELFLDMRVDSDNNAVRVDIGNSSGEGTGELIKIKYCPFCGRDLNEKASTNVEASVTKCV